MKSKTKLIILIAALVVVLASAGIIYGILSLDGPTDKPGMEYDPSAPDFTVLDTAGKPVQLKEMQGKPTVVNFWATWCGYCVMEMPSFDKLYKEYGDRVNFMMVDLCDGVQETQGKANAFIATKGYTFPVYFDTDGTAQTAYQAYSIPLTVFVDQEGNLQAKHPGAMDEETLRYYIENLLGGNF